MSDETPAIITATPNISWLEPEAEYPTTVEALVEEAKRCEEAGASILHFHGEKYWTEAIDALRAETDLILQCGMSSLPIPERMEVFEKGADMISIIVSHHDEAFVELDVHVLHPREELTEYAELSRRARGQARARDLAHGLDLEHRVDDRARPARPSVLHLDLLRLARRIVEPGHDRGVPPSTPQPSRRLHRDGQRDGAGSVPPARARDGARRPRARRHRGLSVRPRRQAGAAPASWSSRSSRSPGRSAARSRRSDQAREIIGIAKEACHERSRRGQGRGRLGRRPRHRPGDRRSSSPARATPRSASTSSTDEAEPPATAGSCVAATSPTRPVSRALVEAIDERPRPGRRARERRRRRAGQAAGRHRVGGVPAARRRQPGRHVPDLQARDPDHGAPGRRRDRQPRFRLRPRRAGRSLALRRDQGRDPGARPRARVGARPAGIRVASVSPGSVDTAMLRSDIQHRRPRQTGSTFDEVKTLREGEQALGPLGRSVRDRRGDLLSRRRPGARSSPAPTCSSTAGGWRDERHQRLPGDRLRRRAGGRGHARRGPATGCSSARPRTSSTRLDTPRCRAAATRSSTRSATACRTSPTSTPTAEVTLLCWGFSAEGVNFGADELIGFNDFAEAVEQVRG